MITRSAGRSVPSSITTSHRARPRSRTAQREGHRRALHGDAGRQILGERRHAAGSDVAGMAVVAVEAVVPHPDEPAIHPVVDPAPKGRRAHGEELRAVVERGVTDPAGGHPPTDRSTLSTTAMSSAPPDSSCSVRAATSPAIPAPMTTTRINRPRQRRPTGATASARPRSAAGTPSPHARGTRAAPG